MSPLNLLNPRYYFDSTAGFGFPLFMPLLYGMLLLLIAAIVFHVWLSRKKLPDVWRKLYGYLLRLGYVIPISVLIWLFMRNQLIQVLNWRIWMVILGIWVVWYLWLIYRYYTVQMPRLQKTRTLREAARKYRRSQRKKKD